MTTKFLETRRRYISRAATPKPVEWVKIRAHSPELFDPLPSEAYLHLASVRLSAGNSYQSMHDLYEKIAKGLGF